MRGLLTLVVPLAFSSVGLAQDMPLFTFLKLGTPWKSVGEAAKLTTSKPGVELGEKALCAVVTKDGATMYVGYADRAAVWAYPVRQDGKPDLGAGAPYAPLRIVEGYDNSKLAVEKRLKQPPMLAVTALALDSAGRLYSATVRGIQIFDPTGRPCGTLPLPAAGAVQNLALQAEPLALIVTMGGTIYRRELK